MNKRFLSTLMAGVAALALGGAVSAAEQTQGSEQNPAAQPADSGGTGVQRDAAKDKDAYFAALSKCDELKSVAEQQQCVDTVRKQYGQM
ncbi:MAG TPA: hypothetical protein VIU02_01035 [Burkholderiales bacterium]